MALGESRSIAAVAGWDRCDWRGLLRAAVPALPALVLVFAWWVLDQFQYTDWVLEDELGVRERVSWYRYGVAGSFLLHIVVCVAAWIAVAAFVLEEPWHGRGIAVAGFVLVATLVTLCVCDGSLHREGVGADGLEFALTGDTRARLVFCRRAASAAFNTTVSFLGAAVVSVAAGKRCEDKAGASEEAVSRWKRMGWSFWYSRIQHDEARIRWKLAREARIRVDRWDGFLWHGSAFAVSGLLFANWWVNWPLVAIAVDGEVVRKYEQIAVGSLGYSALVLVLLLAAIFVPTRALLVRELRARLSAFDGKLEVDRGGDATWHVWVLIAAPGILQVAVEISRAGL